MADWAADRAAADRAAERAHPDRALHATAVAIEGRAVLLLGPSMSGKSRLAAALVDASGACQRIELVGDDRILLRRTAAGLEARPHPRIAGFLERRGLGLVATRWCPRALVAGVVVLGAMPEPEACLRPFPTLWLAGIDHLARSPAVLAWWRDRLAACDAKAARPLARHG